MYLEDRIKSFTALGNEIRNSLSRDSDNTGPDKLSQLIEIQHQINPWFTPENVRMALAAITEELTENNLLKWLSSYHDIRNERSSSTVAVIMAGNIPLVGFHDFLCVLITGNRVLGKTSSKDKDLVPFVGNLLCEINPDFKDRIEFTEGILSDFDAVIATGSDNSSRYFDYYFGKYPNIIRKNRNSIAIIEGDETEKELESLGTDIFSYFGLGCRNVSKIYLPDGYDVRSLIKHWDGFSTIINNFKYANNYDFNKAIYLINKEPFYDSGYLLLKEDSKIASPVSVLFYEFYDSEESLKKKIDVLKNRIQCIAGKNYIPFGQAQFPYLWDYSDGIDTIEFLLKKI